MRSLRHHQLCEENEVCVPVYSMLPVGIMFRGPHCFKKTLACRVVGGARGPNSLAVMLISKVHRLNKITLLIDP